MYLFMFVGAGNNSIVFGQLGNLFEIKTHCSTYSLTCTIEHNTKKKCHETNKTIY